MNTTFNTTSTSSAVSLRPIARGGVTSAQGFTAAGVHAGFRKNPGRADLALVVADRPVAAAGVFTTNRFCAAPVQVSREQLGGIEHGYGTMRAVVINSGNANAATGEPGLAIARETCGVVADALGCKAGEVLVASTGVIGVPLDIEPFEQGVPQAAAALSREGAHDAARAIMTTDTHAKEYAVAYESTAPGFEGCAFTVGGMCKGSGHDHAEHGDHDRRHHHRRPPVQPAALHEILLSQVRVTFNKVTVDSDSSTNDTCVIFASGDAAPGVALIEQGTPAYAELCQAVHAMCENLARAIAADGEGASKLVTVNVHGAATKADAAYRRPFRCQFAAGQDCDRRSRLQLGAHCGGLGNAGCRSIRAGSTSTSWGCPCVVPASPCPSMRPRPCDDSRSPRSSSRPTWARARAPRRCGPATSRTNTCPSTPITVPRSKS